MMILIIDLKTDVKSFKLKLFLSFVLETKLFCLSERTHFNPHTGRARLAQTKTQTDMKTFNQTEILAKAKNLIMAGFV